MPTDRSRRDPASLLPLKPIEVLILMMLTAGDRHGYGIRSDIIEHTEGAVRPEVGNLYRSIRRLLDDGLMEDAGSRPVAGADDERRRYYRLSPFGRRVLASEMLRLRALVRLAEARRLIAPEPA